MQKNKDKSEKKIASSFKIKKKDVNEEELLPFFKKRQEKMEVNGFFFLFMKFDQMSRVRFRGRHMWYRPKMNVFPDILIGK